MKGIQIESNLKREQEHSILQQMKYKEAEYLTFPILTKTGIVKHLFTTRRGGVSKGIYSSMNVSYTRGDNREAVDENYRIIADIFDSTPDQIVCSDQTHTTNVCLVTRKDAGKGIVFPKDYSDIDGLITDTPGMILATFFADCVPLYFVDKKNKAIGLSHSGWKGTVNRMGNKTLFAMKEAFGTLPEHVTAAIGPSICMNCYEVSEDVAEEFRKEFGIKSDKILKCGKKSGKYQLDLWRANQIILWEAGVPKEQIEVTDLCTCCNSNYLFSHRASGGRRGNLGAFMELRKS